MDTLQARPPGRGEGGLVAPLWHTLVLIAAILGLALLQARQQQQFGLARLPSRLPLYFAMILFELVLFGYVWLGLKITRTPIRELIGGRWASLREVARDIGAAAVFWIIVAVVLVVLNKLLGENSALETVKALLPQGPAEAAVWVLLSLAAGFCEEFVFRGYLQRQLLVATGKGAWAILIQAVVFGAAHGYQGIKGMITISVYGVLFGILAVVRKSLRPGMMQHAGQDIVSGIAGSLLARRHYI